MSRPAKRVRKDEITLYIKRQSWVLLILIVIAWLLDTVWLHTELMVVKGLTIGATLSFITQVIFASFVFWHSGYQARKHVVSQLYRGQLVKWLITLIGFAVIFINIELLSVPALFVGFILMKISHIFLLGQIH